MRLFIGFIAALLFTTSAVADTEYFCRNHQITQTYTLVIKDNDVPTLDGLDAEMTFMKTDEDGVYIAYWLVSSFNRIYFISIKQAPRPEVLLFEMLTARGKDINDMEPLNTTSGICQIKN